MMEKKQISALSRSVSGFANALSGICTILIVTQITQHIRPDIYDYFIGEFPAEWSLWGLWGFVVLLALCAYFGISALFQVMIQWAFHRSVRRSGF